MSSCLDSDALPEFDVTILTLRSGTHTVRVAADDASAARDQVQAECDGGENQCPPEWCTDDVASTVVNVRQSTGLALKASAPESGELA
jgi:hypothetical protein